MILSDGGHHDCAYRLAKDENSRYLMVYEASQVTVILSPHVALSLTKSGKVDQQNYGNYR